MRCWPTPGGVWASAFLDQDLDDWRRVVDTNITGTLLLVQKVGQDMRRRRAGRILITGSIAGFMPGTYQAVYNGTKAFLDCFSFALRHELKDSGVTVTCLMPGATETDFFERADMMDTKSRSAEEGRCRRGGQDGIRCDDEGRRRCRDRMAQQAALGDREYHARRYVGGNASRHGATKTLGATVLSGTVFPKPAPLR